MIRALLPEIHARPTGGNLYNKRLLRELGKRTKVVRHFERRGAQSGSWLVDSLLIDRVRDGDHLIAHYLECLDPERRDGARARRERELLARCRAVIATSEYTRDALADFDVITIPPGLDDRYRAPVAPRRNKRPRILTVANLLPGKGLVELAEILGSIDAEWHLAGDHMLDRDYAAQVLGRKRAYFHGPLPPARIAALYDRADLFVLASRFESCSMVTREAMARALPVVAYRASGGLASNLPPETRHLLGDRDTLGGIIEELLADPAERERIGALNRAAAMRFPSWPETVERNAGALAG